MTTAAADEEEFKSAQSSPITIRRENDFDDDNDIEIADYLRSMSTKLARRAVLYVGFCFFVLFAGHAPFRSLLPALKPQSGPLLVAVNFFAYAIGALMHPRVLTKRRRLCFALGAFAHAQWIAVLQMPYRDGDAGYIALTTISSIVNGFGAGLLWSTEGGWIGAYCSLDTPQRAGYYTGIFLSFYGASGFIGNVAAAMTLYFASYTAIGNVVWALFAVATLGSLMLLFSPSKYLYEPIFETRIPPVVTEGETRLFMLSGGVSKRFHAVAREDVSGQANRWRTIKALFCETVFTRSIPGIAALSSVSVFAWVSVPMLCSEAFNGNTSSAIGAYVVPALFATYALANAVGAPLSSLLYRRFSIPTVFAGVALFLVLPTMMYFMFLHLLIAPAYVVYALGVASFIFGIVVGAFNNCLYALYASSITPAVAKNTTLPEENQLHLSGEAYCMHGFFYCVLFTLFSTLTAFIPLPWMAGIVATTAAGAIISFIKWPC